MFLQRVMEQRVRSALDRILSAPSMGADPAELRDYIRYLHELFNQSQLKTFNITCS